jgi:hypothetical protein
MPFASTRPSNAFLRKVHVRMPARLAKISLFRRPKYVQKNGAVHVPWLDILGTSLAPEDTRSLGWWIAIGSARVEPPEAFQIVRDALLRRIVQQDLVLERLGFRAYFEAAARCCDAFEQSVRPRDQAPAPMRNVLVKQKNHWEFTYRGDRRADVKHCKGMETLAILLARPRESILSSVLLGRQGVRQSRGAPVLDAESRVAIERELAVIQKEPSQNAEALEGRDELQAILRKARGLRGLSRRTGDDGERARQAVHKNVRTVIDGLRGEHPLLANHLRGSIKLSRSCVYEPGAELPWQVTL